MTPTPSSLESPERDLTDASLDGANLYEAGFWDAVLLRATWEGAEATDSLLEQIAGGRR